MRDERAVILGASTGIGLATARAMVALGMAVTGTARSAEGLDSVRAELGDAFTPAAFDARDHAATREFFAWEAPFRHLVLTMNSGAATGAFRDLDLDRFRQAFENKFWPYVTALQAALPRMETGGSVTLVTGVSASKPVRNMVGLAASNGALEAMIGTLALELAPIRVNAVSPGVTETPYWDGVPDDLRGAMFERAAAGVPVGRIGRPEEVADAVMLMVRNGFVTGTVLPVDGGVKVT